MLQGFFRRVRRPAATGLVTTSLVVGVIVVFAGRGAAGNDELVPTSDEEVLEQIVNPARRPRAERLNRLRARLARTPEDRALAVELATLFIEESRATGDPRFKGHAAAVLAPWLAEHAPAADVLVLRATLRQSDHDFDGALSDLERALRLRPHDAQAWVTVATVLQVQGKPAEAERACRPLARLSSPLVAATCHAGAVGLGPDIEVARRQLSLAVDSAVVAEPSEQVWARTVLGELYARTGNVAEADAAFRAALKEAPTDRYLCAVYADLLLDEKRDGEVITLLAAHTDEDGLLLRLLLAERALGAEAFAEHRSLLAARFERARVRGDGAHLREEARFTLAVADDPRAALRLATENWRKQREPLDARILLEAALASREPEAAAPVLAHLAATESPDVRLIALAREVRAAAGAPEGAPVRAAEGAR